jgi:hypothetical protein
VGAHQLLVLDGQYSYGLCFQRIFPIVLFIYALLCVTLSAMQVNLGERQLRLETDNKDLERALMSLNGLSQKLSVGV